MDDHAAAGQAAGRLNLEPKTARDRHADNQRSQHDAGPLADQDGQTIIVRPQECLIAAMRIDEEGAEADSEVRVVLEADAGAAHQSVALGLEPFLSVMIVGLSA